MRYKSRNPYILEEELQELEKQWSNKLSEEMKDRVAYLMKLIERAYKYEKYKNE